MAYLDYLPSRNFALTVGSIAVSGILIFGTAYIAQGGFKKETIILTESSKEASATLADNDKDGLMNWEEAVRGSNPDNADSDGDGTLDGEEVASGRNPNKPGPDDSIVDSEYEAFLKDLITAASSTNLTTDVSQKLFAQYVAAQGTDIGSNATEQQELVNKAIASAEVPLRGEKLSLRDIKTVGNSDADLRNYANQLGQVFLTYPYANFSATVLGFGSAMEGNEAGRIILNRVHDGYENASKESRSIATPEGLRADHLKLLQGLEYASGSFEDLETVMTDPIRAVAGFKNFQGAVEEISTVCKTYGRLFATRGILFNTQEPGSIWNSCR